MRRKKLAAWVLVLAMVSATITGCGSSPANGSAQASEPAEERSESMTESTEVAGSAEEIPSWKQDTSDCTVTWFLAYDWYGKKFDEVNNAFDRKLYEETGIKIEIQTGDTDKLNMLIQTGKLPDVITLDANSTQRKLLEDNGLVQPLETLREQYAPDLVIPQSMIDWYTNKDGHWYSIASYYYGDDNIADNKGYYETHNQNYVRDDILKQIGMDYDDLRTKEGFLNALRAVKEQNIEYNGQKVVPYMVLFADKAAEQVAQQLGASEEDAEGNYQSIYTTPEFREAMLLFNQMYREGLLTDVSFTVDKSQLEQEVAAGHVFASTAKTNVSAARESLYATDNDAKILYAGQFTGDTNTQIMVPANNNMGWTATLINKDAENADRIIRLFAYLNTPEAVLDNEWGVGGWTLSEDWLVVREPEIMALKASNPTEFAAKYAGDMGWTSDYTIIQGTYPADGGVWTDDVYQQTHDNRIVIYDDKCFANVAPVGGSDEAAIQARIKEYRTQALGKIITASTPEQCEAELDAALVEMENLGLGKLVAYQNELFQKNKEKLGLAFAFPGNQ
ncbi:MAG: extracellular solute-binding protein [Eisenbergiella porci]|uniref:extracellular solute-binding protein n=1 Tax=Eisenbergiella porci TaxID=2652274 RepID=UPI002A75D9B9|nr:extracellular solute-binding protein [Eisenbergiella porci]MDY2654024.1 extracellular solute-binding protein [Eisenbergiella porci]